VHGPLIATLLADLLSRNLPAAVLTRFEFRAVSPIFDTNSFVVAGEPDSGGKTIQLWAKDSTGSVTHGSLIRPATSKESSQCFRHTFDCVEEVMWSARQATSPT